ncbi:Mfs1.2 [Cristinia sonorae]|uniref:Mfs1.2 n=1 Tax=Cristinia sonorae TaxID=1940300 RepID=A0A8K0UPH0_9AGAR|nr:Mfs1.2 [Cristinia sonorae]
MSHSSSLPHSFSKANDSQTKRDARFWLIFVSICVSLFLSALEFTGLSTALPTIINELHGDNFAWVGSGYALASTAVLPLSGGLAQIFGRRAIMIGSLVLFALGSALCGSAQNVTWLIAARVVQGLGGGGLLSLPNIIVSDLVPLVDRGKYHGIVGLTWALASAIAPLIGGALASSGHWRWFFYLNLPICGVALLMAALFLRLPTPPGTLREKLGRMDWIGNILCIGSTTAFVIGLTWGGVTYPWKSAQVLLSLLLGAAGFIAFIAYEAMVAKHPIIPWTLLQNRTSVSGYIQTFINPIAVVAGIYYLPAYYQACKDASPVRSSVNALSVSLVMAPTVAIAGLSITLSQRYRTQIWVAWCLVVISMGSFMIIHADTALAVSIRLCVPFSVGAGILYSATYFPVLSALPVSENAHALAFFGFCRSFAAVWGISIGAAILQNELSKRLPSEVFSLLLTQTSFPNTIGTGPSQSNINLAYSIIPLIHTLPSGSPLKHEVRVAFAESVGVIWKTMTGIVGIGLLASLIMRDVPMHRYVDERWNLQQESKDEGRLQGIQVEKSIFVLPMPGALPSRLSVMVVE